MKAFLVTMILFASYSATADVKFLVGKMGVLNLFETQKEKTVEIKKIEYSQEDGVYVETTDSSTSFILFPKDAGLSNKEMGDLLLAGRGNGKTLKVFLIPGMGVSAKVVRVDLVLSQ